MIGLIQIVTHANVAVNTKVVAEINQGILALIGIENTDTKQTASDLFNKMIAYRIFKDCSGKTNLSLKDINGSILLVPQFTLVADTKKGLRPGFSRGMAPAESAILFEYLIAYANNTYPNVRAGVFGADMQVTLCNDGPMTFLLS